MISLSGKRRFSQLTEQEILAVAISAEEDDARIFRNFAAQLRQDYPQSAEMFDAMAAEEDDHMQRLIALHQDRFGETIPLIRREHVADYARQKPDWLLKNLSLEQMHAQAASMERTAQRFYEAAARRSTNAASRALLDALAAEEANHEKTATTLADDHVASGAAEKEAEEEHRQFVLTWVQPGLAGLMDGSVSTLAPIFATAFATQDTWTTFLVGLAASIGAGISMGFTEAASDDGEISGRGAPWKRGLASGVMTTLGGLGHALPYLIPHFETATAIAILVVFVELWAIAWIQKKYMSTPFLKAVMQVVIGGALVLGAGVLIGSS